MDLMLNRSGAEVEVNKEGFCPWDPDIQLRIKGRLGGWTIVKEFCPRCEERFQLWLSHQRSRRSLETQGSSPVSLQSPEDAPKPPIEVSLPPPVDAQEPQQNNNSE